MISRRCHSYHLLSRFLRSWVSQRHSGTFPRETSQHNDPHCEKLANLALVLSRMVSSHFHHSDMLSSYVLYKYNSSASLRLIGCIKLDPLLLSILSPYFVIHDVDNNVANRYTYISQVNVVSSRIVWHSRCSHTHTSLINTVNLFILDIYIGDECFTSEYIYITFYWKIWNIILIQYFIQQITAFTRFKSMIFVLWWPIVYF